MIKAIFFDVDGTLVSFKSHRIPDSTLEALDLARKKGIRLFVATGRQYYAIDNLGDQAFDGFITLNGGYCVVGDEVIYRHPIDPADIEALVHYQEEIEPFPCGLVLDRAIYMNYTNETVKELFGMLNFPDQPARPLRASLGQAVYQLIAFFTEGQEAQIMSVLPHCEATRWNPVFADVVPRGSTKAVGIDQMIKHFGIPLTATMAFGDGGNDLPMLRHAGIGVAMGNSDKTVREGADYVTSSVDEDGIFLALKHYGVI